MDKGNANKHRNTYSGGVKAVETSKWGRNTAGERYGKLDQPDTRPPDRSEPQFKQTDGRGPDWADDTPKSRLRGGDPTEKPGYVPGYRPGKK